jgi:hypothetical protein
VAANTLKVPFRYLNHNASQTCKNRHEDTTYPLVVKAEGILSISQVMASQTLGNIPTDTSACDVKINVLATVILSQGGRAY